MKKALMIASFGTTHEDARNENIAPIEAAIAKAIAPRPFKRVFTSRQVKRKCERDQGLFVLNEMEGLEAFEEEGYERQTIAVQPLHVIPGAEYEKLTALEGVKVGRPLLDNMKSMDELIEALPMEMAEDEGLLLFGHGTYHGNDVIYQKLNARLHEKGYPRAFVITAEGSVQILDVIGPMKEAGVRRVRLRPLLIVAGEHAKQDMASEEPGSVRSILSSEGFEVKVELEGLGALKGIQDIFVRRALEVMED